jgi:hypothetical protein
MSILKWLGVVPSDDGDDRADWPDAVRELASKLDELSPEEAREQWRLVLQIVPSNNPYYTKARQWLDSL